MGTSKKKPGMSAEQRFIELLKLEPELAVLLAEAHAHHSTDGERFCANQLWYGYGSTVQPGLKRKLTMLVGTHAIYQHPKLITGEAYDTAYHTIYNALPDCRKCGCISI